MYSPDGDLIRWTTRDLRANFQESYPKLRLDFQRSCQSLPGPVVYQRIIKRMPTAIPTPIAIFAPVERLFP